MQNTFCQLLLVASCPSVQMTFVSRRFEPRQIEKDFSAGHVLKFDPHVGDLTLAGDDSSLNGCAAQKLVIA